MYDVQLDYKEVLVALRKESVDRNCMAPIDVLAVSAVALRKESVDRNRQNYECFEWIKVSLSARRAWIEIFDGPGPQGRDRCRSPQGERG